MVENGEDLSFDAFNLTIIRGDNNNRHSEHFVLYAKIESSYMWNLL